MGLTNMRINEYKNIDEFKEDLKYLKEYDSEQY